MVQAFRLGGSFMQRFALLAAFLVTCSSAFAHETLTPAQKAAGWQVLFDGHGVGAWRGYKQDSVPENWTATVATLTTTGEGPDLITRETFGDFELEFEWKAPEKGNSGIIYRVSEEHDASWMSGPEFQILDDDAWGAATDDAQSAGSIYGLVGPSAEKTLKPAGEWNHARIRVKDGVAQHFLNGAKILETRIDDDTWRERIAGSKFASHADFCTHERGHIALQSHGNPMEFRNIRIRELDKPMPGEVKLFDGQSLQGWRFVVGEHPDTDPASAWAVKGNILITDGEPVGFLRTSEKFTNYVLKLEWRFNPETRQAGNSGVLLRVTEDKVWPHSLEAQLLSESAGDILTIGDFPLNPEASRNNGRHTKHASMAENAVGEWNEYEIICDGEHFVLKINGTTVNEATGAQVVPGWIAVQSEGAEIHFRNIRLAPIK
jgi:hypothetical protein